MRNKQLEDNFKMDGDHRLLVEVDDEDENQNSKKDSKNCIVKINGGNGFFCKFLDNKDKSNYLYFLITCNHVFKLKNGDDIHKMREIKIIFSDGKERTIGLKNRRIWVDKENDKYDESNHNHLDYTCIEVFNTDGIFNFLSIDDIVTEENISQQSIYILNNNKNECIYEKVNNIKFNDNNYLVYDCNNKCSSGAPILNRTNDNEEKIIGIHNPGQIKENTGIFIKTIINDMLGKEPLKVIDNSDKFASVGTVEEELVQKDNKKKIILFSLIGLLILILIIIIIILATRDKGNEEKKDNEVEEIIKSIYLIDFYSNENENYQYNSKNYVDNYYIFNESGLHEICVYGATANQGGRGGSVCGQYIFKENETLYYELGGREAGGSAGLNCGTRGRASYGAGRALANCSNGFIIIGGGGGGSSENGNKGGDAGEDGEGKYGGKGATTKGGGRKGNPDMNLTSIEYAQNGTLKKGGKGGNKTEINYWCGGGGGDGFYGGGGGCYGKYPDDGGGGGGSHFHSNVIKTFNIGVNKKGNYSGIIISRIIK